MESGRERLLAAARTLLAEHPHAEPSTRELLEAAGVAAPTLYHHFGDKTGLLEAVTEEAFDAYLERKRAVPRTGDLLSDFEAGWDMHVAFGVANPALYALMYGQGARRPTRAAQTAETDLRRGLEALDAAGLLRLGVDEAIALTTAMAVGCVTQLNHGGGVATGPLAGSMRTALMSQLLGDEREPDDVVQLSRLLLGRIGGASEQLSPAEAALMRQWLHALADQPPDSPEKGPER